MSGDPQDAMETAAQTADLPGQGLADAERQAMLAARRDGKGAAGAARMGGSEVAFIGFMAVCGLGLAYVYGLKPRLGAAATEGVAIAAAAMADIGREDGGRNFMLDIAGDGDAFAIARPPRPEPAPKPEAARPQTPSDPAMINGLAELRDALGGLKAELTGVRDELAAAQAANADLRQELERRREDAERDALEDARRARLEALRADAVPQSAPQSATRTPPPLTALPPLFGPAEDAAAAAIRSRRAASALVYDQPARGSGYEGGYGGRAMAGPPDADAKTAPSAADPPPARGLSLFGSSPQTPKDPQSQTRPD